MLIAQILNYYKFYNIITYDKPTTLHLVVDKYISSFGGGCQQVATYIFIYITRVCAYIRTTITNFAPRNKTYRHLVHLQQ